MYYAGQDTRQDFGIAEKWLRMAAQQDESDAQYHLGVMHEQGDGVPQNKVLAYMWLDLAAANANRDQQNKIIRSRDSITASMTTAEISRAQELARQCTDNRFKGC